MKNRILKIISILGGLLLILQLGYPFILKFILKSMTNKSFVFNNASHAASIGIIGGADGPTAIFLATGDSILRNIITAICLVITIVPLIIIWQEKKKK